MKIIKSEVRHWYNDLGDSFYAQEYEDGYEITDRTKSVDYVRQGDFLSKEDFQNLIEEHELESEPVYSVTSSATKKALNSSLQPGNWIELDEDTIVWDGSSWVAGDFAPAVVAGGVPGQDPEDQIRWNTAFSTWEEFMKAFAKAYDNEDYLDYEEEDYLGFDSYLTSSVTGKNIKNIKSEVASILDTGKNMKTFIKSSTLTQHKGKANLSLYYTPEEIEALQPDEHGKPTRTYEEGGWVEDKPKEDWTEEFTESFEDGSFDLTNPAMNLFLSDLQKSLDSGDYRSAIEQLHDMGYSPEDASDLVFDFKNGIMTPQELFSRVRLFDFLKSASLIRLNQNGKVLSVYADKINSHTSRCKAIQFRTLISSEVSSLKSCFELDRGKPIEFKPSNPEFLSLVSSLSRKEQNFKMVPFKPSVNITSRVFKSPAKSIFQNFQIPEAQNLLYKEIPCFELNF